MFFESGEIGVDGSFFHSCRIAVRTDVSGMEVRHRQDKSSLFYSITPLDLGWVTLDKLPWKPPSASSPGMAIRQDPNIVYLEAVVLLLRPLCIT